MYYTLFCFKESVSRDGYFLEGPLNGPFPKNKTKNSQIFVVTDYKSPWRILKIKRFNVGKP
jgi:hypothetical protein